VANLCLLTPGFCVNKLNFIFLFIF
jgi:hypothetical protein